MKIPEDADIRINDVQCRGIVLKDEDVLVMFRKKNGEEYYVFPGGHMREGEDPVDTTVREIYEETTVKVKNLELAFEFKNYVKKKKVKIDYYYVAKWESGEPVLSGEESRRACKDDYYEPMWVSIGDISELTLYPLMAKEWTEGYLERFLEKRK